MAARALLDAPTLADVTVQIAEISALAGDTAQAAAFRQKFLDASPATSAASPSPKNSAPSRRPRSRV